MPSVLITGGSRGIGRATSLMAAERGWSVGVNYVSDEKAAQSVVAQIAGQGGKAVALKGDVAREEEVVAMFESATYALDPLDGVVLNGGVAAPPSRLANMTAERMRRVF